MTSENGRGVVEAKWVLALVPDVRPVFVSNTTVALLEATRHGAGIAVLPRYLGDADATLRHIPMPDEPCEPIWITVHRDVRSAARVRAVVEHLKACFERDQALLAGTPRAAKAKLCRT